MCECVGARAWEYLLCLVICDAYANCVHKTKWTAYDSLSVINMIWKFVHFYGECVCVYAMLIYAILVVFFY